MNAFLLSLGLALLAVLIGALAAPFFIDWSSQREFFEARAAEILGRPVEFAGPLEVRLVPFPRLTAQDVRIGDPGGQVEGAERVAIRAALTPLLSGELEITEVVLTRPRVTLSLDSAGGIAWAAERGDHILPMPPERTRLERLEVVEGTLIVADDLAGTEIEMTGLNLTGSAGSLAGPFRLEGGGLVDGRRYTLRIVAGRLQQNGAVRFTASVVPADRPLTFELDGSLEILAGEPLRYRGGVVIAQPAIDPRITPWRVEGDVVASPRRVEAEALNISIGQETERLALGGAVSLELGPEPRFDAALSARQLDFDRAYGGGAEAPVAPGEVLARIAELLDSTVEFGSGRLSLEVGSVVLAGNLVEGLHAQMNLDVDGWHIADARAQGPGMTDVQFSGRVDGNGGRPTVDGRLQLDSRQAGALAGWLFGPGVRLPGLGALAGPLEAAADLSIGHEAVAMTRLEIVTSDTRLTGEISYAEETDTGRPSLAALIETDRLSFDRLRRSATGASSLADVLALAAGTDLDLAVDAGAVHVGGVDLNDVTVVMALSEGDLRVDRLRIGDLGGARIDGHGEIRNIASSPTGRLEIDIAAGSLHSVADALAALGLPETAEALSKRADALVPVQLALSLDAAATGEAGSRADVAINGTTGDTTVDLSLGFEGRADRLLDGEVDLSFEADNPDGSRLVEQIGLTPARNAAGPGRFALTARGRPDSAMAVVLDAAGLGLDGRAEGDLRMALRGGPELSGHFEVEVAGPVDLLGAAGISLPLADAGPVSLAGRLSAAGNVWRFSELAASSGMLEARGSLGFDLGAEMTVADGKLELSRLDLPWLLGALLGPDAFGSPASPDDAWSREAFRPAALAGWRGRLHLSAPQLDLGGGYVASEGAFDLYVSPGRVVLENLRGGMFGGRLSGDAELATLDGALQFESRLELDSALLEELAWQSGGRALAAGTLSLGAELSASGRSLLGLVSTLSGSGSLRVEEGVVRRMNPRAFDHIVRAADAGLALEEEDVRRVFASHLDAGSLLFDVAEGSFSLAAGVARTRNIRLDGAPLHSFASATFDLTRLEVQSEWLLRVAAPDVEGRSREVAIIFSGPIAAPRRDIDVAPLLGYLSIRAFEQEVQRLEELQTEIQLRNWRRHELMRFGRDRRRFERERADRLRRLEEEALEPADNDAEAEAIVEEEADPAAGEPAAEAAPSAPTNIEELVRDALRGSEAPSIQPIPAPDPQSPSGAGQPMNIVPPFAGIGPAPATQ